MRKRPTARVILVDNHERVLLFRFVFTEGALAGTEFWATPGGAVDEDETFEQAARRELFEETGIRVEDVGIHVQEREFEMTMPDGEQVIAEERLYLIRAENPELTSANQTEEESLILANHRWWHLHELKSTSDKVYPEDLHELLLKTLSGF